MYLLVLGIKSQKGTWVVGSWLNGGTKLGVKWKEWNYCLLSKKTTVICKQIKQDLTVHNNLIFVTKCCLNLLIMILFLFKKIDTSVIMLLNVFYVCI